ncbi:EXS family-domain-containing protein [Mycena sanguinolenta]|nr:EXS family-domain-containing protein [Mycena sanguinolenta]
MEVKVVREDITRLRAGPEYKSHHASTFSAGVALGSALVALGSGIAHSREQNTRDAIPGWDGLLFIYGVLAVPPFFALLVGLNLLVLDHREYFQIPSILFATLCYAFWLSFARIGAPTVDPSIWPLVWLGFAAVMMFDPLPIFFKPSRYWLIKHVGTLLKSGMRPVEFTDFYMGDQFCSFAFTLSNITLIGTSKLWPLAFVLTLPMHLINAGKYGAGIISYLCYFIWRHRGGHYDAAFPRCRHWLLRQDLVYTNYIFMYYFAVVLNILLRLSWIFYIPANGPDNMLRYFIVAGLGETIRRWIWNFFRVENESQGGGDQYNRVTRAGPLPYAVPHEVRGDFDGEVPRSAPWAVTIP